MKIIDLLNKIANGDIPKRIIYDGTFYCFKDGDFKEVGNEYSGWLFANEIIDLRNLNDEVEILEEKPKVQVELTEKEYLEYLDKTNKYMESVRNYTPKPSFLKLEEEKKIPEKLKLYAPYPECEDTRFEDMEDKINEIIDYLDYLKSKGE